MDQSTEIFEAHRDRLFRLAYSMLGRIAPAEDAVQEAFLRWQEQDAEDIQSPRAFLSTIISRICLDELKSARNRKKLYIGPDLPEPILTANNKLPDEEMELAESLSMALLVVLDQLNPIQRAVYILREIFDYDYTVVANMIDISKPHCRKIAQRARDQIRDNKPQFETKIPKKQKLVQAFIDAVQGKDLTEIEHMLTEEAILFTDGGGKVPAAPKPILSAHKISKFLISVQKQATADSVWKLESKEINEEPGLIARMNEDLKSVWSFQFKDDKIQRIYIVGNPDKLGYIKRRL